MVFGSSLIVVGCPSVACNTLHDKQFIVASDLRIEKQLVLGNTCRFETNNKYFTFNLRSYL